MAPAIAIAESVGNRRWIGMANLAARAEGILAKQPLATALAVCPRLVIIERDEADEQLALREAALAMLRFTPGVSLRPSGLIMEVAASLRLFGGKRRLLKQLKTEWDALGLDTSMGIAPTAGGATLLAHGTTPDHPRWAQSTDLQAKLDPLPVHLLEGAQNHLPTLAGIGCTSLAHLRRLPRSGVARRFGPALLTELDQAYGLAAEPQLWFSAPERFKVRLELAARVEHAEALVFAAGRLTTQLAGWLVARHAAVSTLTLTLHHAVWRRSNPTHTPLVIRLSEPCRDPQHLQGLLRERLSVQVLDAPVEELSLEADDVSVALAPNQELFPTSQSEAVTLNRLIEKLRARLGHDAVRHVHSETDHRPEKAWKHTTTKSSKSALLPTTLAPRPTWLLQSPRPLPVREHRPFHGSSLILLAGPERIEAGWWDDARVARDYYIAENTLGQLLWIFRERKALEQADAWYLHGLFA